MKFKALIFASGLSLFSSVFATNYHVHPEDAATDTKSVSSDMKWPGYCEIEIINQSYDDVRVYGVFDDGMPMQPFNIYSYESPHYISLFYYGYCHAGMELDIDSLNGYHIYSGYTRRQSTIRILPYLGNKAKAEVHAK